MDHFVNNILEEWGLVDLQKVFKDHAIDEEAFNELDYKAIEEIITQWGWRNKFLKKYKQYNKSGIKDDLNTLSSVNDLEKSLSNLTLPHNNDLNHAVDSSLISSHQPIRYLSLKDLLNSSLKGRVILKEFEKTKIVDRPKLIDLVVWHEMDNPLYKISSKRFVELADEIVKIFPNELKECYYIPRVKTDDTFMRASGALQEKYNNCRRKLNEVNMIAKPKSKTHVENPVIINDDILWLKNNLEPFEEIVERWKRSFDYRDKLQIGTVHDYFNEFKFLRGSNGYKLLELDFNCKHKDKIKNLSKKWPEIASKIIGIAEKKKRKKPDLQECLESYSDLVDSGKTELLAFLLLPLVIDRRSFKSKSVGKHFMIDKKKTQQSFLLHVETEAELKKHQIERAEYSAEFQLTIQPYVVICGPVDEPTYSAVFIDNVKYCFENPIDAIDICLKIFYSLNVKFPIECEHVWIFLAQFVYELPVAKNFSAVYNLIKEINHYPSDQ